MELPLNRSVVWVFLREDNNYVLVCDKEAAFRIAICAVLSYKWSKNVFGSVDFWENPFL